MSGSTLSLEFDDIIFALQSHGGITQYWQELTRRMSGRPGFTLSRCQAPAWQRLVRVRSDARVFHSSYLRLARGRRVRNVISVHDLGFELGHLGSGLRTRLAQVERRQAYAGADALVCVSEATRRDLLTLLPHLAQRVLIRVIHHGPTLDADAVGEPLARIGDAAATPFVLFVGGRKHYKNFDGALAAFAACGLAAQGGRMLCTGSPFSHAEQSLIQAHALTDRVVSLGTVSRAALVTLYRHAHCLLYPSRFEGFGMPVLEAMTLGCPVVAADRTSIPEIAGDAGLLADPADSAALGAAIASLGDPHRRAGLIAAGLQRARAFSWQRSVDQHAALYAELA